MRRSIAALLLGPVVACCLTSAPARADDSAAEIAAGGIELRKEPRISMEKERLVISTQKVSVEFEFLNESAGPITTEVAFPVPPYTAWDDEGNPRGAFIDFRIWVDGHQTKYEVEARATLKGKDYTSLLQKMGVDIATFGHVGDLTEETRPPDFQLDKLPAKDKMTLKQLGLVDEYGTPTWTVEKMYHWKQLFPSRKPLHIRHEYRPIEGFRIIQIGELATLKDACIDSNLQKRLSDSIANNVRNHPEFGDYVYPSWVKYILTTANTWRTPIKDFTLVIQRPARDGHPALVSFCWDGKVERIDHDHFRVHQTNFTPSRELTVYYFWNN